MSTTDPGIENQISETSNNVDRSSFGHTREQEKEEEAELLDPSRYWFMSTACPLLASTFGPIATAFSILALVYEWRVYIPPGETEDKGITMTDPSWLIAVNALSLVAALMANMSLLLNMAKRLRFSIAQPITIAGFFLSSILLIADISALTSSPSYDITYGPAIPDSRHALSSAVYYAIFAAAIYFLIAVLMCLTVWGANQGFYERDFNLTASQRTLMLQTMSFVAYLLLGALVFCKIEGWEYLNAVYWANVTLLTVGLGDMSPSTRTGRGLLFPFAIGGILMVGLVVGSIRTLALERGESKLSARITEKKRAYATRHVNTRKNSIRISTFSSTTFVAGADLTMTQRRREEFETMRKVQAAAERERRWMALLSSSSIALVLWFAGAAIFMRCERDQGWTYFQALYFSYTSLLTIGYGDYSPMSNSGKPFFVLWSLLAVPSLTILISNMGDTIVKWFSDLTVWVGTVTVLPNEGGFRTSAKVLLTQILPKRSRHRQTGFTAPGILGILPQGDRQNGDDDEKRTNEALVLDRLAERLSEHVEDEDLDTAYEHMTVEEREQKDTEFYHYVLARECRNVQNDISARPPRQYSWADWEYFLKLIGNSAVSRVYTFPGQRHPDVLTPAPLRCPPTNSSGDHSAAIDDRQQQEKDPYGQDWSWMSSESPLLGQKTESEWLLERLLAALERETNRQRKGYKKRSPIRLSEMRDHIINKRAGRMSESSDAGAKDRPESQPGEEIPNKAQ
ncbi:hypothetical protein K431DRAFT_281682 [Polychaeton citri CBS 116435]|uniref:Potassium channel domain-containing protein n=1 Tax=Polychaeton citri CBS 116435 TaxID=1314669 RepID=A0A9P4QH01_9PEZI|nr:hypothetical protein K431DRAFT_281682 [Polychaeton citri CBS 116435]